MPETMWALVFDRSEDVWEHSRGLRKVRVPRPMLDEAADPADTERVLIRVIYSGFCGSDRGIWFRKAFRKTIHDSLDAEGKSARVFGHELFGEIVQVGRLAAERYGYKPGDFTTTESHIICGRCHQCLVGDTHVCSNEKTIGFSIDGCFAEYVKLPASALWPTDTEMIRPEVACVQEPFGNAVHACTKVDLRGKTLAIFGCGTIGLFALLVARAVGVSKIIGIEPNAENRRLAKRIGVDAIVGFEPVAGSWERDPAVVEQVRGFGGEGVDVAMEMSGQNSSLNSAISSVRRGGDAVLFGINGGDFTIQDFSEIITNGISMHSVFGRQIFRTWCMTRNLLESAHTGVQEKVWDVILNRGEGTIVDIADYEPEAFERSILAHPKIIIKW